MDGDIREKIIPCTARLGRYPDKISAILFLLLILLILFSLTTGKFATNPGDLVHLVISGVSAQQGDQTGIQTVFWDIRLPRVLAAVFVGTGLAISGAALQGMFNNPLVSPQFLGITGGAAFGSALAFLFSFGFSSAGCMGFVMGIVSVILVIGISRLFSIQTISGLILAGIIIDSLFQSCIGLIKYLADPNDHLPSLVYWMMGSFNHVTAGSLILAGPVILLFSLILYAIRWQINLLSFGEETAETLGVPAHVLYVVILLAVAVITSASVTLAGPIGWIGLVIPNMVRVLTGPDHLLVIPCSALLGGSYLLLMDTIARTIAPTEIPVGILTAVIGVPVFVFLLRSQNRSRDHAD
jgi:iron complex transport system permease protein